MEITFLNDIVIIFGLSIVILFVCHRLLIPTTVGFLLTGMLAGPYGLGFITAIHEVEIFAEVGVVLLLFSIGIEFSLERLLQIRKSVLLGGSLQVLLTLATVFFIVSYFIPSTGETIFIGFLVTLSSTAIVLKLTQERAEVDSPQGNTALGILIYQDIVIVPMILITPILAGVTGSVGEMLSILLAKGIGIIILILIGAKWIVPHLLYQIAKTRNREIFLLSVIVICLSVAWLTSMAGLSLALGAFLAGLVISESEYSQQALGNILPFLDVFTSFFFVSIGMLLNISFLFHNFEIIAPILLSVLLLKSIIIGVVTLLLGFPLRIAILVGLSLSQVGEFSFILAKTGVGYGLLSGNIYQIFLAVSVLSMALTPFIVSFAPRLAEILLRLPLPKKLISGFNVKSDKKVSARKDHLVIIGFGINGSNLAKAAKVAGISYAIIEMNPETVRNEQMNNEPIYYGDATHEVVLDHAHIKDARIAVIAINDPVATRRITEHIRRLNPIIYLIVRTRYLKEMNPLYKLGANEVIPEEFETSVEIFTRVLTKYLIPRNEIEIFTAKVRADAYDMFRSLSSESPASFSDLKFHLADVEFSTIRVEENSFLFEKTLAEIDLRKNYEVTILAIYRDSQILYNPNGDEFIRSNDVIYVLGAPEKISEVVSLLQNVNK